MLLECNGDEEEEWSMPNVSSENSFARSSSGMPMRAMSLLVFDSDVYDGSGRSVSQQMVGRRD